MNRFYYLYAISNSIIRLLRAEYDRCMSLDSSETAGLLLIILFKRGRIVLIYTVPQVTQVRYPLGQLKCKTLTFFFLKNINNI